ncbi:MAG: phage head-tail connector protein [Gammaproteobacteria bacterium]|nr:phage head-tail connector protein [Gammaproteobacteria bacterium]
MNLTRAVDPILEPVTLTEVKDHLRITGTDNDTALNLFISAIREKVETFLGKTLFTSTWQLKLDGFTSEVNLPMSPVASISSIAYTDTDGNPQTFTDYQFDRSGRLKPSYGNDWPSTRDQFDAVTITYVCGEAAVADIRDDIKLAILLWIGACDVNRENVVFGQVAEIPDSAKSLLFPHRNIKL